MRHLAAIVPARAARLTLALALGLGLMLAVAPAAPSRAAKTVAVSIVEPDYANENTWGYDPNPVTVAVGDSVVWTNKGDEGHDVTADDGSFVSGPDGNLGTGDSFSYTFAGAGSFGYSCKAHPWMHGTVVVQ